MKKFERSVLFALLREHKIKDVNVEFSGGNDEGGVDSITVCYEDGRVEDFPSDVEDSIYDFEKRTFVEAELSEKEKISKMLTQPVWDQYGGFAGDFHVYGNILYDVETETIVTKD